MITPEESSSPSDSAQRPRWVIPAFVVGTVIVVVATVAVSFLIPTTFQQDHQVQGVIQLIDSSGDITGDWDTCEGTGGYGDVQAGAAATMRDAKDEIIGSLHVINMNRERLQKLIDADTKYGLGGWGGDTSELEATLTESAELGAVCMLYFSGNVHDADFYSFTFAKRGGLTYSRSDLDEQGWWIVLSLGGK